METQQSSPIQTFLEVQRLIDKLGLTPADCLLLLLDVLRSSERVAREEEATVLGVPDREGLHPTQFPHHALAALSPEVQ